MNFEYVIGQGVANLSLHRFEFFDGRREPIYFDFAEENAVLLGQLLMQALRLVEDFKNER